MQGKKVLLIDADAQASLTLALGYRQPKPFPQEQEYKEKSARLEELGVLLNMDEKDSELIDGEPDEENAEPQRKDKGRER